MSTLEGGQPCGDPPAESDSSASGGPPARSITPIVKEENSQSINIVKASIDRSNSDPSSGVTQCQPVHLTGPPEDQSPLAGAMMRPLMFVGSPGQPYDAMHAQYASAAIQSLARSVVHHPSSPYQTSGFPGMMPDKSLPEPVRKYCIGCGEIVDFASGRARACGQRLCGRIVCMTCYDHAMEKGVNMYHMESGLCAVCEYQNKKRPGGSISYWHSTFHDQEDLEFVRTLRDGLPQVNGLFLEVYGQRQACWRRRVDGIRKHYSFKQHGGYFESRLQSIFQHRDSPTSGGPSGGMINGHSPPPLTPYVTHGPGTSPFPLSPGVGVRGDMSAVVAANAAGGTSVDITDVLTGTTEEPRCAMCCHFMSDRQQFGIFACQADYCGRIFCGQCVGEGRAAGIAMFHTNTQMCIICTFQNKMTRIGKKPYIPHTWHFDFFPDRELDVDFLRHLTKALPKVDNVWLDLENLVWRTQNQVFLFAAHGGFLEARWAAIQDLALQQASSVGGCSEASKES